MKSRNEEIYNGSHSFVVAGFSPIPSIRWIYRSPSCFTLSVSHNYNYVNYHICVIITYYKHTNDYIHAHTSVTHTPMTSADTLQCTLLWWPSEWFLHVHHCLIEIPRYDSLNIHVLSNVFFLVDCKGANVLIVYEYSDRRKIIIENSLWYIFKMSFYCHKPYNLIYIHAHGLREK